MISVACHQLLPTIFTLNLGCGDYSLRFVPMTNQAESHYESADLTYSSIFGKNRRSQRLLEHYGGSSFNDHSDQSGNVSTEMRNYKIIEQRLGSP